MTSSSSLRDLYVDPNQAWAFLPPKASSSAVSTQSAPIAGAAAEFPSNSTKYNLPYEFNTSPYDDDGHINLAPLFRSFVTAGVLQYTSTAIVMPWEVGKLLLQVQWVPKDAGEPEPLNTEGLDDDNEDALSDASGEDSYFADPHAPPSSKTPAPRARTDDQGYVIRRSVLEEGTRPEFIIPVGSADGVWGMMKRVGGFRAEGWLALWKGLLTACVTEVLSDKMQPFINGFLQSLFFPSMSPFHRPPIILPVASHLITGFLLSPLDLIRTRLVIQSFTSRHRTYTGPIDAFHQILRDEGGLRGMYLHPHLLLPTLLDNALRPIVALALPGMLTAYFGWGHITEETHPIKWGMAELAGSCIGLLVTLPIETIRRRLQAQVRGSAKPVKTCVELRPAPYNGIVDAFWHILTEERSDLPITRSARKKRRPSTKGKQESEKPEPVEDSSSDEYQSWWSHTGVGQLYRGLGMRLGASAVVFVLAMVGGGEESADGGWAEI